VDSCAGSNTAQFNPTLTVKGIFRGGLSPCRPSLLFERRFHTWAESAGQTSFHMDDREGGRSAASIFARLCARCGLRAKRFSRVRGVTPCDPRRSAETASSALRGACYRCPSGARRSTRCGRRRVRGPSVPGREVRTRRAGRVREVPVPIGQRS